jgi:hypothetical protein
MAKRTTNSPWGKPISSTPDPGPCSFEEIVKSLSLAPDEYEHSTQLKAWVRQNKGQKYVPPILLQAWGMGEN